VDWALTCYKPNHLFWGKALTSEVGYVFVDGLMSFRYTRQVWASCIHTAPTKGDTRSTAEDSMSNQSPAQNQVEGHIPDLNGGDCTEGKGVRPHLDENVSLSIPDTWRLAIRLKNV
jgi:hypothetical protein